MSHLEGQHLNSYPAAGYQIPIKTREEEYFQKYKCCLSGFIYTIFVLF
jgi:hypothetical protein